jgi:hypothetical protein
MQQASVAALSPMLSHLQAVEGRAACRILLQHRAERPQRHHHHLQIPAGLQKLCPGQADRQPGGGGRGSGDGGGEGGRVGAANGCGRTDVCMDMYASSAVTSCQGSISQPDW